MYSTLSGTLIIYLSVYFYQGAILDQRQRFSRRSLKPGYRVSATTSSHVATCARQPHHMAPNRGDRANARPTIRICVMLYREACERKPNLSRSRSLTSLAWLSGSSARYGICSTRRRSPASRLPLSLKSGPYQKGRCCIR
jgi:hypothetical protein